MTAGACFPAAAELIPVSRRLRIGSRPETDSGFSSALLLLPSRFRRKEAIPCPAWFCALPMRESVPDGKPIADGEVSDDWS